VTPLPREAYRALARYRPDRRPVAVDLSDNTNRWGAHPAALRAVREADPEELLRYPPVYADHLRAAVARKFGVPEEAVATGCGSDDLLDSAFRAACDPGEAVRFVPPTFSMVEIFALMNGLKPVAATRERAERRPEVLLEGDPGIVYLCRPNNPTGGVHPRPWVERLIDAAGPDGPVILLDEAYADFAEDDFLSGPGIRAGVPGSGRLVVLRTLSKAYGLAGLRVGFAVGPPDVIGEIEKSRGPYKVSRPAEAAAVAALDDAEGWVTGLVAEVRRERGRLGEALRARGFRPPSSEANFLLLPLESHSAASVAAALRERGVAVRPFPALAGIGEAVRVTIGPPEEMARFLDALAEVIP
jgi:histidinol-phosphate aminotransferase